jgi:hypothetical protein
VPKFWRYANIPWAPPLRPPIELAALLCEISRAKRDGFGPSHGPFLTTTSPLPSPSPNPYMPFRQGRVVLPSARAWGTRFDTLQAIPPSPPAINGKHPANDLFTPTLQRPPSSPVASDTQNISVPATPAKPTDASSNDSSIFVGRYLAGFSRRVRAYLTNAASLPPHIDHIDLGRRLSDHLAPFVAVKQVKVIRDNRGGVCAFVRCKVCFLASSTRFSSLLLTPLPSPAPGPHICYSVHSGCQGTFPRAVYGP